jgi:hypothetical protein
MSQVVPGGRPDWLSPGRCHGTILSSIRSGTFLSAAKIMRMSDRGVENVSLRLRKPGTDGKPVCPGCGCMICYACPGPAGKSCWRCQAYRSDFSITSGTLLQAAAADVSVGHRCFLQRGQREEHAGTQP